MKSISSKRPQKTTYFENNCSAVMKFIHHGTVILRHGRHVFSVTGDVCHKIKALMSIIIFFILIFYFFIYIYILFVSLLSGCCAISGFERHLRLADHSPRFHVRTLNPAG